MLRLKTHLSEMEGRMNKLMSALNTVQEKTAEVAETATEVLMEDDGADVEEVETMSAAGDESDDLTESSLDDNEGCGLDSEPDSNLAETEDLYEAISSSEEEASANDLESARVRRRHVVDSSEDEELQY